MIHNIFNDFKIKGLIYGAITTFGNGFFYMGMIWYALSDPLNGVILVGIISFLEGALKIINLPLGAFIEYHNKKTLLLASCIGMVIVQLCFAFFVGFKLNIFFCVLLYVFHEVFQNLNFTSMYVYSVNEIGKDNFENYNAKLTVVSTVVTLLGNITAAFVYSYTGFIGFVIFDLICYFVLSFVVMYFKDRDKSFRVYPSDSQKLHPFKDSVAGLKYIFSQKQLLIMTVGIMAVNMFMLPFISVTMPLRLKEWLPQSFTYYNGFIAAGFMVGMILGSVLMTRKAKHKIHYYSATCIILIAVGAGLAALFNIYIWLTVSLSVVGGFVLAFVNITVTNATTLLTPVDKLSRVNGATTFMGKSIEPLGAVLATTICGTFSPIAGTVFAGTSVAIVGIILLTACIKLGYHKLTSLLPEDENNI